MEDIKKHLTEAYTLISKISVSGDGVDLIASVRHHLRTVAQLVKEKEESEKAGDAVEDVV